MKTNAVYEKPEMIEYPYFGICGEASSAPGGDVAIPCDDFAGE